MKEIFIAMDIAFCVIRGDAGLWCQYFYSEQNFDTSVRLFREKLIGGICFYALKSR